MFNVEKFLFTPKTELLTLRYAKKQELLTIAKHWNITVDPSHVKARLINDILQFLIQKKAVDEGDEDVEDVRSLTGAIATPSVDPEMEKLKLQMQATKLAPEFNERDPEVFFKTFEDTAATLNWPKDKWVLLIRNHLKGVFVLQKEGHDIQHCPLPQCKRSDSVKSATSKPEQPSSRTNQSHQKTLHVAIPKQEEDPFKAFTCAGSLNGIPVECLRDTGSTQTIVNVTKDLPLELTNEYITVTDLTTSTALPLAKVRLCCPYFDGDTVVAVTDKQLPHSSVQVILGNDLAGSKVLDTNLIITDPQIIFNKENTDKQPTNEAEIVQVATRSAREDEKANLDKQNRTTAALDITDIHKDDFKYHQRADPSLAVCWKKVSDINDLSKTPCFYQDKDFLFRLFRPSKSPSTHTWLDQHQLVVPSVFRKSLLDLAHSTESHLGIHKTFDRLAENFFWPGMKKDVKDFVQITGKPNESIPPAPLQPIPVPKNPFDKVIIDCVGPLPKTRRGNEYLLTVLCPTTRYPLAIPIKNIHAKTIIGQLLKVFTTFGFPKELQCDQGTNFTSNLFRQAMAECSIRNVYATTYNPQTNGALERVHQTVKSLLRKYISETSKTWDEELDLLMYILRSVPNDSTGISPFELMFGRKPRTTLSMVKEDIINKKIETVSSVSSYLSDLKEKLLNMYNFAFNNISISQILYDRKAKLEPSQKQELTSLLLSFPELCSDQPQDCTIISHDIMLEPGAVPHMTTILPCGRKKLEILRQEVKVMPFGLCNAPATFQRLMSEVIRDLDNTYVYKDDLVVATNTWSEHLDALKKLFQRLSTAQLTINLAKSSFGLGKATYLGHVIGNDASGTGFGGVLMQQHQSSLATPPPPLHHLMPIAYYSGYFKGAQTRWATIEKKLYAIIAALLHFKPYLEGNQHVIIYTDHNPLIFLDRAKLKNNKLLRWSYILSEFNIKLQAIQGPQNILADTLSGYLKLHPNLNKTCGLSCATLFSCSTS
ncbi:uncharacterized protein [Macrobrachium rosenbergii]|uniref:uncharacterized protein n=1 Tax=Macrobrachium rosenbergii TaxID=79674 RepID=UPI0034D5AC5A